MATTSLLTWLIHIMCSGAKLLPSCINVLFLCLYNLSTPLLKPNTPFSLHATHDNMVDFFICTVCCDNGPNIIVSWFWVDKTVLFPFIGSAFGVMWCSPLYLTSCLAVLGAILVYFPEPGLLYHGVMPPLRHERAISKVPQTGLLTLVGHTATGIDKVHPGTCVNQHLPCSPNDTLQPILELYFHLGMSNKDIAISIMDHFDPAHYGIRPVISEYLRLTKPDAVDAWWYKWFKRWTFIAIGLNGMWSLDQHDKSKHYGLFFHVGLDPFLGVIHWCKVWWTVLPNGVPMIILQKPHKWKAADYKISIPSEVLDKIEKKYAPPDDPIFELIPHTFVIHANVVWTAMGSPQLEFDNAWEIYLNICDALRGIAQDRVLQQVLSSVITADATSGPQTWNCLDKLPADLQPTSKDELLTVEVTDDESDTPVLNLTEDEDHSKDNDLEGHTVDLDFF
ncbi:hypothetical protein EDB86DRAFT_2833457 [Lactarius hatsudake]|nr:hypothetical protein EDB86DRAFT_2833457 [Lactarius hatsudake]